MDIPLLGQPLLIALGLDIEGVIEAACDKMGREIGADDLLPEKNYPTGTVARYLSNGVYHADRGFEETNTSDPEEGSWLDLGEDSVEEHNRSLNNLLQKAIDNAISLSGAERLKKLLRTYSDIFRIRLGDDPPAQVAPMEVEIRPGSTPHMARAPRYTPDQREFMAKYVDKLEEYGFVCQNQNASWVAAPLLEPKAPPALFRLTFDLRRVNACTVPVAWPMPHIDSELLDLSGSRHFATIDFCSGYWQLPLSEESQEYHSFMTPNGTYSPTRTLQGATNSGANFQSRVETCFKDIQDHLKAWLDDFLLHNRTEEGLLDVIEHFFKTCQEKRLKISATKSVLYTLCVRWCGRVIDGDGVRCDPQRLSGLMKAHYSVVASELCQCVHCLQWMSNCIPDFAERIQPLGLLLEEAYKKSGSRKKKSIQSFKLTELGWNQSHTDLFDTLQEKIRRAVALSQRDSSKTLCVFTDASEEHWAAVCTQCDPEELQKQPLDQQHEPLAFLSGMFNDTEYDWSTFEKEAFSIYQVFLKLDYMLAAEHDVHVFTDHRNLLFVYNPQAMEPALGRHIVSKVQRWALYLSRFMHTIEHVSGDKNIMADIMTRWFVGYRGKRRARRITTLISKRDILQSPLDDKFEWPSHSMIQSAQIKAKEHLPKDSYKDSDGTWCRNDRTWIPNDSSDVQLKLLVVAHCGCSGHRGVESTTSALAETFYWDSLKDDCKEFVKNCIHCMAAKGGNRIPRPLSMTLHASKPNEILNFDFLYMAVGSNGLKYVLVLRDDFSSYTWLCPTFTADAATAAAEISRWIRVYTTMSYWVSDQASHFKNEIMGTLARDYKIQHKFTVAYSPWTNDTVESCMSHILADCRALLSEWKLGPQDWPWVIRPVMSALNEAPLKRSESNGEGGYRCPIQVMTGLKPNKVLLKPRLDETFKTAKALDQIRVAQLIEINKLQSTLDQMHKAVAEKVTRNKEKQIQKHNQKTNLQSAVFHVADYVLVRHAQDKGHKLMFRWIGPRRVAAVIGEMVYDVTGILDNKTERVHAARMVLYRADLDGKELSDVLFKHVEHSEAKYDIVEKLLDVGKAEDGIFVQVQWTGLPDKQDWTWNKLHELYEDIPEKLTDFLRNSKKKCAETALTALGLK